MLEGKQLLKTGAQKVASIVVNCSPRLLVYS